MSNQSQHQGSLHVADTLSCRILAAPEGCIDNQAIRANAGIDYTKSEQMHVVRHAQKAGTAVSAETVPIHIAIGAGVVVGVKVVPLTPPTSSDTVTFDLKKGNVSTAYATVLTGVLTLNSSSVTRTVYDAVIATPDYAAGDSFELVIAVSGTSAQGFVVEVIFAEAAM